MEGFAYGCAVILAAIFVRAGAAKLARPQATAAGFAAVRVPAPALVGRLVPPAELALAATLLAAPGPGGVAALVLLGAFTAVLARAVRAGLGEGCACFGAPRAEPVSSSDLLRNGMLGGLALGALDAPGPAVPSAVAAALLAASLAAGLALLRWSRARAVSGGRG